MIKKVIIIGFIMSLCLPQVIAQHSYTIKTNKKIGAGSLLTLPTRIAYFGDSFTAGAGSTYPNQVFTLYPSIPFTNYAVSSTTVWDNNDGRGVPGSNLIDKYQTEINLGYTGQLVSIAYGLNDYAIFTTAWHDTLQAIVNRFIAAGWPAKRILLVDVPTYSPPSRNMAQARIYIAQISAATGCLVENLYQVFIDTGVNNSFFSSGDGFIHPTSAGQTVWANDYVNYLLR